MFTRFYLRPMHQEQVFASLMAAAAIKHSSEDELSYAQAAAMRKQLLLAFGRDDEAQRAARAGSVPKALMMMNGPLTIEVTKIGPGTFLQNLLALRSSEQDVLDYLFMAAFSRKPAAADVKAMRELMAYGGDPASTYQDIWWALLNSNEFIFSH